MTTRELLLPTCLRLSRGYAGAFLQEEYRHGGRLFHAPIPGRRVAQLVDNLEGAEAHQ